MSDERIDAIRKRLANSYGQSEHFIGMMSDMRYLLDHIAALEARNQALENQYESGEPGTQGATLKAFYAIAYDVPGYSPVNSRGALNVVREHIKALEDVWDAACGVIGVKQQDGSYRVPAHRMQALMDALNALNKAALGEGE